MILKNCKHNFIRAGTFTASVDPHSIKPVRVFCYVNNIMYMR